MEDRMKINDQITVGAQPTEEQLQQLVQDGFKAVVNLRTAGEEDQPVPPEAEGEKVRELGMRYLHIAVSTRDMRPEQVDQFRQNLPSLPSPVYVHCHKGLRAGAFAMMHIAIEGGMSGGQTLETAAQMGFPCEAPKLKAFVKGYVDQNRR